MRLGSNAEYQAYVVQQRAKRYHIISPIVDVGALPPQWALVPRIVKIDPDPTKMEVYRDGLFCKPDEVALTKVGLRKMASAAGISTNTTRVDSGHVRFYWSFQCEISFRSLTGEKERRTASYEWDLTDGSPRIAGMSAKELSRARLNGMRRCEAGAINAAIREIGIPQKFNKPDLDIPFVVFNLVFQPDMSDPQQAAIVTQAALSNTDLLFPSSAGKALPPAPVDHADGEVIDDAAAQQIESQPDVFTLTKVYKEAQPDGSIRYYVTAAETDEKFYTVNLELAGAAKRMAGSRTPCEIASYVRDGIRWIDELVAITTGEVTYAPASDDVFITDIKVVSGENKATKKPWTRRTITFSTGEVATTFYDRLAAVADRAWKEKLPVTIVLEENEQYPDQKNLKELSLTEGAQLPAAEEL